MISVGNSLFGLNWWSQNSRVFDSAMSQVELYDVIGSCTEECLSHTCAECSLKESRCSSMGNNALSALLWKRKRVEVGVQAYPSPEWSRGEWGGCSSWSQICLLFVRTSLVLRKILLNLHYIYRTVSTDLGFWFISKVLSGGRPLNTSPRH